MDSNFSHFTSVVIEYNNKFNHIEKMGLFQSTPNKVYIGCIKIVKSTICKTLTFHKKYHVFSCQFWCKYMISNVVFLLHILDLYPHHARIIWLYCFNRIPIHAYTHIHTKYHESSSKYIQFKESNLAFGVWTEKTTRSHV